MPANDASTFRGPPNGYRWHMAFEQLEAGRFEEAARLLYHIQVQSEQSDNTTLANTLAAVRQICLACTHFEAEIRQHQQASADIHEREQEIVQLLLSILEAISGHDKSRKGDQNTSQTVAENVNVFQRLRDILRVKTDTGSTKNYSHARSPEIARSVDTGDIPLVGISENHAQSSPRFVVHCLGAFRVEIDERYIHKWPGHKAKSTFKYMITHRDTPIHQEILMELFWPEADPKSARRNLYQTIYKLRQALQADDSDDTYILSEDNCYLLNPEFAIWVDSEAFLLHYQTGQQSESEGDMIRAVNEFEMADELYEGDFMAEDLYDDWIVIQRENLKQAHLDILDRLSRHNFEEEQWAVSIAYCQKVLAEDNCREDAHRRLMRCYLHQGQANLALRQYHSCADTLDRELDVTPMPATVELYEEIQQSRNQVSDEYN